MFVCSFRQGQIPKEAEKGTDGFHRYWQSPRTEEQNCTIAYSNLPADHQLQTLESSFERQKYLSVQDRMELASKLNLTDTQVKTW